MYNNIPMPMCFDESLMILPPKGTEPNDDFEIIREPENLRPLSLNNSDKKTITVLCCFLCA